MNAVKYLSHSNQFNRPQLLNCQLHPHRQLWGVTSSHLARSGELERMLSLERAESQRLRGAVAEDDHGDKTNEVKGVSLLPFKTQNAHAIYLYDETCQNDFDSIRCGECLFGMPSRQSWQRGQLKQKHEMLRETPRKRSPDGKRMEKMELGINRINYIGMLFSTSQHF